MSRPRLALVAALLAVAPAGFAAMLSPATLQRLRDLSVKISDTKR